MIRSELENSTHNSLNEIAHHAEGASNVIFALTGIKSALDIFRDKSPKNSLLTGIAIAVAIRAISVVCDLGVDAINNKNGLA